MKRYFLLMFAGLVICFFSVNKVNACGCAFLSPSEAVEDAEAVFLGKVIREVIPREKWQVKVSKIIKGSVSETIDFYAANVGTSCEISNFKLNETYIIFARKIKANEVSRYDNGEIPKDEREKIGNYESMTCSWTSTLAYLRTKEFRKRLQEYKDEKFLRIIEKGRKPNKSK